METFSKLSIENLITRYGEVDAVIRNDNNEDIWILADGVIIRLPAGFDRIPMIQVEMIAEAKLQMHPWEFDYWLGQQNMI